MAAAGEASTVALIDTARRMFDALMEDAEKDSARVQVLREEFENNLSRVWQAAVMLEAPPADSAIIDATQRETLLAERQRLRTLLQERNRDTKDQIDMLRQLLLSTQLSGV